MPLKVILFKIEPLLIWNMVEVFVKGVGCTFTVRWLSPTMATSGGTTIGHISVYVPADTLIVAGFPAAAAAAQPAPPAAEEGVPPSSGQPAPEPAPVPAPADDAFDF